MRKELEGTNRNASGQLEAEKVGTLVCGSAFSRLVERDNENCPEYILGQMAIELGYAPGAKVRYRLIVEPKENTVAKQA